MNKLLIVLSICLVNNAFAAEKVDKSTNHGLDNGKSLEQRKTDFVDNYSMHALDDVCDKIYNDEFLEANRERILDQAILRADDDAVIIEKHTGKMNIEEAEELIQNGDKEFKRSDAQAFVEIYQLCMKRKVVKQMQQQAHRALKEMRDNQKQSSSDSNCVIS